MPGPSVMVRILGDASNLAKAAADVGSKFSKSASTAHAAFSSMLGTLNQTGVLGPFGDALNMVDQGLSHIAQHGKDVGGIMLGAGGSLLAVGGLFSTLGSKEKAAQQQLSQAITNTGHSYADYGSQIDAAVKHNEKFGDSSVQTQQALQTLTSATHNPTEALKLLSTATDLAAAKHIDLNTAATAVGKTYNGNTKLLKQFGITMTSTTVLTKQLTADQKAAVTADTNLAKAKQKLSDLERIDSTSKKLSISQQIALRNAQQAVTDATTKQTAAHQKLTSAQQALTAASTGSGTAMAQLSRVLSGQASAASNTFSGHLKAIQTHIEDQVSLFGEKYGPTLQKVGAALTGLGGVMKIAQSIMGLFTTTQEAAATATDVMSASEDAAAVSEGLALAPILLIIAAIALLIAAAYEIATHWKEIWAGIQAAVEVVWNWIKANWPLLLGILLGPIGLAVALIYKYWAQIEDGAKAAVDWIVGLWNGLVGFFTGVGGRIASVAVGMWNGITNAFQSAINGIYGVWNTMWGWLTGLGGAISGVVGGMWNGIRDAFRSVINDVIDLWNRVHFTLPKVSFLGAHLGGETIGVPTIPHLAQGGLMTASGLVYAHAGEVISPAPPGVGRGPVVHIENAKFSTEMDVESFMKQVAWVATTRAV